MLRPAGLASFARNHASKNRDFSYHFFATNLDCLDGFFRGFGSNYLNGSLPSELGNLAKLEQLCVLNNFSFSIHVLFIFAWMSRLHAYVRSYSYLLINCRYIDSAGLSGPLPSSFSRLTRMKILYAYKRCYVEEVVPCNSNLIFYFSCV